MKRVLQMRMFALRINSAAQDDDIKSCGKHVMIYANEVVNDKKSPKCLLISNRILLFYRRKQKAIYKEDLVVYLSHLGSPHTPSNSLYLQLDIPSWFFNSSKTEQKIKQSKPVASSLLCKEMARVEGHETVPPFIKLNGTITSPNRQLEKSQNLPYLQLYMYFYLKIESTN